MIESCLRSILKIQDWEFELIVVNDRSTDKTSQILSLLASQDKRIRIIDILETPPNWSPKKWAVTNGVEAAKHPWLFFTDADCLVSEHWISGMMKKRNENTEILLGISPYHEAAGFLNAIIQYETINTAFQYAGFACNGLPYMGVGRNLAYKKELFLKQNGLTKHAGVLSGDDDLFVNAAANAQNTVCILQPETFVLSIPKNNWKSWFTQKLRHVSASKHYQFQTNLFLGFYHLSLSGFLLFLLSAFFIVESVLPVFIFFVYLVAKAMILRRFVKLFPAKIWYLYWILLEFFQLFYQFILVPISFLYQTKWK